MPVKLYLDENIDVSVAAGLRRRGIDVVTARDRGKLGATDEEHLALASSEDRLLVTHDIADFAKLHQRWLAEGKEHAGIALSDMVAPGVMVRRIVRLCESVSPDETKNRLLFLTQFAE